MLLGPTVRRQTTESKHKVLNICCLETAYSLAKTQIERASVGYNIPRKLKQGTGRNNYSYI